MHSDTRTLRQQRIEIQTADVNVTTTNTTTTIALSSPNSHGVTMTPAQEQILQAFVLISCSLSFISLCFVILHHLWDRFSRSCGSRWRRRQEPHAYNVSATPAATSASPRDFNAQLVFILSWIDLSSIIARMVGRTVMEDDTWCLVQATVIHAGGLASCLWTTCMSFNLYRWIVYGESDKKRRARLGPFLFCTLAPSILLTFYPLRAHKYGNATFYCWIMDPLLMFVHFYVYYVILAVINVALLLLIRINLKQRVQWHDSASTDVTSAVIRRKALLYLAIFLVHRIPIIFYRTLEISGLQVFALGVAVQFILNLDGFSNAVVYGGLLKKIPSSKNAKSGNGDSSQLRASSDDNEGGSGSMDSDEFLSKRFKNTGTLAAVPEELGDRMTETSVSSNSTATTVQHAHSTASSENTAPRPFDARSFAMGSPQQSSNSSSGPPRVDKKRRFAAGLLDRASIELGSDREIRRGTQSQQQQPASAARTSQSISIFVSTFNMGEHNISDGELVEWIPIGHEIYVIGVQECMNLGDLQGKILNHLIANTKQKYVHFSREIGKRATALGYHGYIALTVFVLEAAILEGRFEMPQREAMSKHAQEVYRGKSLLLFGRASNKGAVGLSFRYGNTSFAFVTCHLASDSSSSMSGKKISFRKQAADGSGYTTSLDGASVSSADGNDATSQSKPPISTKTPPSKVARRNQDAMEILQHLHLDEEDYGLGFPLLHHHSFVLGDLNYRMSRKGVTPREMLDQLSLVGLSKSTASTARTSSGASSRSRSGSSFNSNRIGRQHDQYAEVATPTMMRLVPDLPAALNSLIREHDELTALRESCQLFYGFQEPAITFFPTFRRIRGEILQNYDSESLSRNYSLMASGGGYRVPSYTDRILHTSLPGRQQQVQCLYYDSCEAVTTSDHKPVSAVFRVAASVEDEVDMTEPAVVLPSQRMVMPHIPSFFGSAPVLRRKNSGDSACDVSLKVEFRSIQWMDALDDNMSGLFSRLENVELGFLFPLPCEDVLSHQRKLQEVAENLNWGESIGMSTPAPNSRSPVASTLNATSSNFHVMSWNSFVEQGLRYNSRVAPRGKKHVALLIRTRTRTKQRSGSSSRSRSRSGSIAGSSLSGGGSASSFHSTGGLARTASFNSARSFASSGSYEFNLGHGTFCIEKMGKRQVAVVPLTVGGNLVGRLSLRVTLQERLKE